MSSWGSDPHMARPCISANERRAWECMLQPSRNILVVPRLALMTFSARPLHATALDRTLRTSQDIQERPCTSAGTGCTCMASSLQRLGLTTHSLMTHRATRKVGSADRTSSNPNVQDGGGSPRPIHVTSIAPDTLPSQAQNKTRTKGSPKGATAAAGAMMRAQQMKKRMTFLRMGMQVALHTALVLGLPLLLEGVTYMHI